MSVQDPRLLAIVERIERLLEERRGVSDDIRDVYGEAKAVGYDAKFVRQLIARRAMKPADRAEADTVLQVYEAAIGMADAPEGAPSIEKLRPDAVALAANLLAAEIVALEDPSSAQQLVEHVLFLLDLRAEIALLRGQESDRRKLVKAEGFDPKQVAITVRWFEKVAKHGERAMRLGEETFHQYRGTFEQHQALSVTPITADAKLAAAFAPAPPKSNKSTRTLGRFAAQAAATRRALGEE